MSERQIEPHQAEDTARERLHSPLASKEELRSSLILALDEVARLRAERDQYREAMGREWKIANDMAADAQEAYRRAEAAEARAAKLQRAALRETYSEEGAQIVLNDLARSKARVAELEAERARLIASANKALRATQDVAKREHARIDRAVTERTAEIVAWMETAGDGSWWDAAQDVRHEFLAPTRTQEARCGKPIEDDCPCALDAGHDGPCWPGHSWG